MSMIRGHRESNRLYHEYLLLFPNILTFSITMCFHVSTTVFTWFVFDTSYDETGAEHVVERWPNQTASLFNGERHLELTPRPRGNDVVYRLQKLEHEQGDFRKNDTGNSSHLAKSLPRATGDCHPLQPSSHIRNFLAGEKLINKFQLMCVIKGAIKECFQGGLKSNPCFS